MGTWEGPDWASLGVGAVTSFGKVQQSPVLQRSQIPIPRKEIWNPSTKCLTKKQPSQGKVPQPWARFGEGCCGSRFRTS